MKVYLLETGCYEDRWVMGVYATPEAAMAAHSPAYAGQVHGSEYAERAGTPWSYQWHEPTTDADGLRHWSFGADWSDAAGIDELEVQE